MEPLVPRSWIIGAALFALAVIVLDEAAYTIWKRTNRGEHWSHVTEKTPLQTWEMANVAR